MSTEVKTKGDAAPPPAPATLTLAEKVYRPVPTIEGELADAKALLQTLRRECDRQWEKRQAVVRMHNASQAAWRNNPATSGLPFDPALVPMLPPVPPDDTGESRKLHKLCYAITRLEAELAAARRAAVTFD